MRTQPIHAREYWNDTGVQLKAQTKYRFSVVPNVGEPLFDASFAARTIEGEDWKSAPHMTAELFRAKRVDDAKWFALIGTVDKQHPWVIKDGDTVPAPASGTLFCYFNDVQLEVFYKNNKGFVVLEVEEVA
jgi:hypothetical protein